MKEIKHINGWRDAPCSWVGRINIVKMSVLPNAIYRFSVMRIITNDIFHKTRTRNLTVHIETQKTLNNQSSLEKEEWSWRTQPSWFRLYYKATISYKHHYSMVLAQKQKYRLRKQDKKPRNTPMHLWVYLIFDRGGKNIQWGKDSLFNKWCWGKWTATCKRMKLEHFVTPYTKINSKWIKDLNLRPEIIKLLRGKHRKNTWWHKSKQDPLWPIS